MLFYALLFASSTLSMPDTGADWPTFNGGYAGDRYSSLTEITTANVGRLRRVATFETGVETSFQTGPVVVDGTLYFTTHKHTYAINAANGKLKWKDVAGVAKVGLGSHRGAAYSDGRVFRGYSNGYVVGFDAASGKRLWSKAIANAKMGESVPMAPIAWDGKVFVGNAGGDNHSVTGRVYALDAKTGKELWVYHTVPKSGPALATWKNKQLAPSGGATWTSYSLDQDKGILYVCAGNPAPDFDIESRPGANLYTNSMIALDARTGKFLAYCQPTKEDTHDWDLSAAPALITTKAGKRLAAVGGKDGMLYGIDVSGVSSANGSELPIRYRTPVTRRFNVNVPLSRTKGVRFAPGPQGGIEWNGPSYDPVSNLVFTPAIDWPSTVKLATKAQIYSVKPGQAWAGSHDGGFGVMDKQWGGYLSAVDADTGKKKWSYKAPTPLVAAVTSTAGGIVFSADVNGDLIAFESSTGKRLWKTNTGRPCGGGIVSYAVNGKQYVAVASGLNSPIWRPKPKTTAKIVIYALP